MMRRYLMVLAVTFLLGGCASLSGESELDGVETANLADLLKAAEREFTLGNLEIADKMLVEAEKLDPKNERMLFRRGTIAFHRGDMALSASLFERCINANPLNGKAHYNLATIRLHQSGEHFKLFMENSPPQTNRKPIYKLLRSIDEFAEESESAGRFTRDSQSSGPKGFGEPVGSRP
jgi:tetratricopeptide (TPR) repeat protein